MSEHIFNEKRDKEEIAQKNTNCEQNKVNLFAKFFNWVAKGSKKAMEKGIICG